MLRSIQTSAKAYILVLLLSLFSGFLCADSPDHKTPDEEKEEEEDCGKCDKDKTDCKEATCGDPFYLHNGEFFWEKEFLAQPESPLNLAFRMRYSTFSDYNGFTGARWTPNYNMRVYETDAGNLIVRKNKGTRTEYKDSNSDNVFESQSLRNETVTILGDGSYRLTTRGQISYYFDTDGKLTAIKDTKGNELRVSYDDGSKHPVYGLPIFTNLEVAATTDLSQRQTEPVSVVRDYRVSKVEEYLNGSATGRFLKYTYDVDSGQLTQVHDQSWDEQSGEGLRVKLAYDAAGRGDLEVLTDPNANDYTFTYFSDSTLKYEAYYRFMESFVGESCSDCSKRWLTYYGGTSANAPRVRKQVQGPDKDNPIGEIVEVTNYATSYTDTRYTLKEFGVDGVQIGADRYRYERVYFVSDSYGDKRVDRKYVSEDMSYGADDLEVQFVLYNSNPSSDHYHGDGKEYLDGRIKLELRKNGSQIEYDYDANGNRTREAQWVDLNGDRLRVVEMRYDSANNKTREMIFYEESGSSVGGEFITVYEYDSLNRMTAEKRVLNPSDPEASWTYMTRSYAYVGTTSRILSETAANGKVIQYQYSDTDSDTSNDDVSIYLVTRMFDPSNSSDQTLYTYDANGFRDSMTNALGQTWFYVNDELGRRQIEIDSLGYQTTYEYTDGGANIQSIERGIKVGEQSRKDVYGYDALSRRNVTSRVDAADVEIEQQRVSYDNEGRLVQTQVVVDVDAQGQPTSEVVISQNHYTVLGLLKTTTTPHPSGPVTTTYQYDDADRLTVMLEPTENGTVRTETLYDGLDRVVERIDAVGTDLQRSVAYAYDALGNVTSITYSGEYDDQNGIYNETQVTRYYYDSLGRQVGINWNPANATPDADGARELPSLTSYDACCDTPANRTDGEGNTTVYSYDDDERLIGINWDFNADAPLANYEGELPQKLSYDVLGNLLSRIDGEGRTVYYHYDDGNRQTHMSVPQPAGSSLTGNWWETPANVMSSQSFNGFGQVLSTVNIVGGTTSNNYDRFGRVQANTDLNGLTLQYTYSNLDQITTITYPEVNVGDGVTTITNNYNPINPQLLDSSVDRAGDSTSFTYTVLNQQKTVATSLGAVTTYGYDALGRAVSESTDVDMDGNMDVTSYTYDQFNQLETTTYPDHVVGTNERIQTQTYTIYGQQDTQTGAATYDVDYGYDLAGNRTHMTTKYGSAGMDATTIWHYNSRNQLERKEYADASDYDYTYDDAGNMLARTDAKEQQTVYSYNDYNQLDVVNYPNDTDIKFGYDSFGRRTAMYADINDDGTFTASELQQEWSYFTNNQVDTDTQYLNGYEVSYTYTAEGQRLTRTVDAISGGDAWTLTYGYDASGRMNSLLDPQVSNTPFAYTYHPDASLIAKRTNPNSSKLHYSQDVHGRLISIATRNAAGTDLERHSYTYNKVGLRNNQTLLDGSVRDYDYDARRQLEGADDGSKGFDFAYTYDAIGNRLSSDAHGSVTNYTLDNLNQYTAIGASVPVYDANGSLTSFEGTTYFWDDENRLDEVYRGTRRTVSTYDGMGRRIKRQEYSSGSLTDTVYYVYDGNLPVLELEQAGTKLRSYTRGLDLMQSLEGAGGVGGLLAVTIHDTSIGTLGSYTYGYDGNGNVTVLLDSSEQIVANYTYGPFGEVLSSGGALAAANPYQFSTKEYEADWQLNYYLYRFYSSKFSRWLNRDPIAEAGGINLFSFVANQPISLIDLWGEQGCNPRTGRGCRRRNRNNSNFNIPNMSFPSFMGQVANVLSQAGAHAGGSLSTTFILGILPPGFSLELTVGASGKVENCCDKDDGNTGQQFAGSVDVTLDAGYGTIIGGNTNRRITQNKNGTNRIRNNQNGRYASHGRNSGPGNSFGAQKMPICVEETEVALSFTVSVQVVAASGFARASVSSQLGQCSTSTGCKLGPFTPQFSVGFGPSGVGFRASISGTGQVSGKWRIH